MPRRKGVIQIRSGLGGGGAPTKPIMQQLLAAQGLDPDTPTLAQIERAISPFERMRLREQRARSYAQQASQTSPPADARD